MSRKSILRMIFLMVIGAIIGATSSIALVKLVETGGIDRISNVGNFLAKNNIYIFIFLIIALFIPSVYLFIKGKSIYNNMNEMSDDEYDIKVKSGQKKLDIALTLNGIFMIFNFMILGTTLDKSSYNGFFTLIIFMINILLTSVFEIKVIRYIQKVDSRLKGDPTTLKFSKDFVESCDEAEKLKIYKSGYHAFQTSKFTSIGFIVITMICNMTLNTGKFAIFVSCCWMLINTASYGYYSIYKK